MEKPFKVSSIPIHPIIPVNFRPKNYQTDVAVILASACLLK